MVEAQSSLCEIRPQRVADVDLLLSWNDYLNVKIWKIDFVAVKPIIFLLEH